MSRVKFDTAGAVSRLKKKINELLVDDNLQTEVGIFLTERIRFEARTGKPLNDSGSFPDLKDSSKGIRAGLAKSNKTHPAFSPDRSNLTFSGQLQDALSFKRIKGGVYELFIKATARQPVKTKGGKAIKSPNNKKVDEDLRSRGFNLFTGKGLKQNKKIARRIKQILLRFLRRKLK